MILKNRFNYFLIGLLIFSVFAGFICYSFKYKDYSVRDTTLIHSKTNPSPTITALGFDADKDIPGLFTKIVWGKPANQLFTVINETGGYEDIMAQMWSSQPISMPPSDFAAYYDQELLSRDWVNTGMAMQENLHSFWKKNGHYFIFGYEKDHKLNQYSLFVAHN